MKKIVVPKGMLEAFFDEAHDGPQWSESEVKDMLAAALGWLSENPIVPPFNVTEAYEGSLSLDVPRKAAMARWAIEWQRKMFFGTEPNPAVERIRRLLSGSTLSPEDADEVVRELGYVTHGWDIPRKRE
jgi:hypothetical protein